MLAYLLIISHSVFSHHSFIFTNKTRNTILRISYINPLYHSYHSFEQFGDNMTFKVILVLIYMLACSVDSFGSSISIFRNNRYKRNNRTDRTSLDSVPAILGSTLVFRFHADVNRTEDTREISDEHSNIVYNDYSQDHQKYNYDLTNFNETFINSALSKYYNFYINLNTSEVLHNKPHSIDDNNRISYISTISSTTSSNFENEEALIFVETQNHSSQGITTVNETLFNNNGEYEDYEHGSFSSNYSYTFEYREEQELFNDEEILTSHRERHGYSNHDIFMFIEDIISDSLPLENKCRNHSLFYLKQLNNYVLWAVKSKYQIKNLFNIFKL